MTNYHGLTKHPLYQVYYDIIKRCENKKCWAYPYYGGSGVTMCIEWRNNFVAFYDWALKNGWERGMHIDKDKIPKELGIPAIIYSPEMCSILSKKDNMNAMSTNVDIEYLGRKQTISQWADEYKVNYKRLWGRLKMGWTFERALLSFSNTLIQDTNVLRRKKILNTETGVYYFGAKEAAESVGINTNTLHCKLLGKAKNNTPFIYV